MTTGSNLIQFVIHPLYNKTVHIHLKKSKRERQPEAGLNLCLDLRRGCGIRTQLVELKGGQGGGEGEPHSPA